MAREAYPGPVTVCMAGGHGEWFVQDFGADGLPEAEALSLAPDAAKGRHRHPAVTGSRAAELAGREGIALELLPDGRRFALIPAALLTPNLAPLYGRPPDARLPA